MPATPTRDFTAIAVEFARTLRHGGVAAGPDRVQAMLTAVAELDATDVEQVYWAGRLTLCGDPADLPVYDAAFALYFSARTASIGPVRTPPAVLRAAPFDLGADGDAGGEDGPSFAVRASRHEQLRQRDVTRLTPAERAELQRLFTLLRPRTGSRRTQRYRPGHRGRLDRDRTVRAALRHGGEVAELRYRRRRVKPRRLVLLLDVSGSMAPYADPLLRFAHAATRIAPHGVETFTIGTRLTRVTRELRRRDADAALTGAGRAVPDWSGGTRLGDMIKAFLDLWGQRGVARGAVVVLCSDGWERGDPAELGRQLGRLARLAHRVIWVNPHKGRAGFEPATGGMVAALPHLDHLVAGHTFAALEELAGLIGRS